MKRRIDILKVCSLFEKNESRSILVFIENELESLQVMSTMINHFPEKFVIIRHESDLVEFQNDIYVKSNKIIQTKGEIERIISSCGVIIVDLKNITKTGFLNNLFSKKGNFYLICVIDIRDIMNEVFPNDLVSRFKIKIKFKEFVGVTNNIDFYNLVERTKNIGDVRFPKIELHNTEFFKEKLVGDFIPFGDKLLVEKGFLIKNIGSGKVCVQNPPESNEKFVNFVRELLISRRFRFNNKIYKIKKNFNFIFFKGYEKIVVDYVMVSKKVSFVNMIPKSYRPLFVLNSLYSESMIYDYKINNNTGNPQKIKGILPVCEEMNGVIVVVEDLPLYHWNNLFHYKVKKKGRLEIIIHENLNVPNFYMNLFSLKKNEKQPKKVYKRIMCKEITRLFKKLMKRFGKTTVVRVSKKSGKNEGESVSFTVDHIRCELTKLFKKKFRNCYYFPVSSFTKICEIIQDVNLKEPKNKNSFCLKSNIQPIWRILRKDSKSVVIIEDIGKNLDLLRSFLSVISQNYCIVDGKREEFLGKLILLETTDAIEFADQIINWNGDMIKKIIHRKKTKTASTGIKEWDSRNKMIVKSLKIRRNKFLFFEGPTSTGKSFYVVHHLKSKGIAVCSFSAGENLTEEYIRAKLLKWAKMKSGKMILLHVDEANLLKKQFFQFLKSMIWGSKVKQNYVWMEGEKIGLTSKHKVILSGNNPSYTGRNILEIFDYCKKFEFSFFSSEFIQERVVEPILLKILSKNALDFINSNLRTKLSKLIVEKMDVLQQRLKIFDNFLTARDCEHATVYIALKLKCLTRPFSENFSFEKEVKNLVLLVFFEVCGSFFNGNRNEIRDLFEDMSEPSIWCLKQLPDPLMRLLSDISDSPDFYLSRSVVNLISKIFRMFEKRSYYLSNRNSKPKGKIAALIIGTPASGKDETLKRVFECLNFKIVTKNTSKKTATCDPSRIVYLLDVSFDLEAMDNVVLKAKKEGSILWIQELDVLQSSFVEGMMNEALAGESENGFAVFATINGTEISGRNLFSDALMNRFLIILQENFSFSEMICISRMKMKNKVNRKLDENLKMVMKYHKCLYKSLKLEEKSTLPNLREFMQCVQLLQCKLDPNFILDVVYGIHFTILSKNREYFREKIEREEKRKQLILKRVYFFKMKIKARKKKRILGFFFSLWSKIMREGLSKRIWRERLRKLMLQKAGFFQEGKMISTMKNDEETENNDFGENDGITPENSLINSFVKEMSDALMEIKNDPVFGKTIKSSFSPMMTFEQDLLKQSENSKSDFFDINNSAMEKLLEKNDKQIGKKLDSGSSMLSKELFNRLPSILNPPKVISALSSSREEHDSSPLLDSSKCDARYFFDKRSSSYIPVFYFNTHTPFGMIQCSDFPKKLSLDSKSKRLCHVIINAELFRVQDMEVCVLLHIPYGECVESAFLFGEDNEQSINLPIVNVMGRFWAIIPSDLLTKNEILIGHTCKKIVYNCGKLSKKSFADLRNNCSNGISKKCNWKIFNELKNEVLRIKNEIFNPRIKCEVLSKWFKENIAYELYNQNVFDHYKQRSLEGVHIIQQICEIKAGCCTESSWLFSAVLREAFNIPTCVCSGYSVKPSFSNRKVLEISDKKLGHSWVIVRIGDQLFNMDPQGNKSLSEVKKSAISKKVKAFQITQYLYSFGGESQSIGSNSSSKNAFYDDEYENVTLTKVKKFSVKLGVKFKSNGDWEINLHHSECGLNELIEKNKKFSKKELKDMIISCEFNYSRILNSYKEELLKRRKQLKLIKEPKIFKKIMRSLKSHVSILWSKKLSPYSGWIGNWKRNKNLIEEHFSSLYKNFLNVEEVEKIFKSVRLSFNDVFDSEKKISRSIHNDLIESVKIFPFIKIPPKSFSELNYKLFKYVIRSVSAIPLNDSLGKLVQDGLSEFFTDVLDSRIIYNKTHGSLCFIRLKKKNPNFKKFRSCTKITVPKCIVLTNLPKLEVNLNYKYNEWNFFLFWCSQLLSFGFKIKVVGRKKKCSHLKDLVEQIFEAESLEKLPRKVLQKDDTKDSVLFIDTKELENYFLKVVEKIENPMILIHEKCKFWPSFLKNFIEVKGMEIIRKNKENSMELVGNLIRFRSYYQKLLCENSKNLEIRCFSQAIREAFAKIVNCDENEKFPELFSLFLHKELRKFTTFNENELENILDDALKIIEHIEEKDVLKVFYKIHLGKRLLDEVRSGGFFKKDVEKIEKYLITRLKPVFGIECYTKVGGMINDIVLNREMMGKFKKFQESSAKKIGFQLSVQVLTSGFWTIAGGNQMKNLKIPLFFKQSKELFEEYYHSFTSGRILIWNFNLGKVCVVLNGYYRLYEVNCSVLQMIILELFNLKNAYSFLEIKEKTGIPEDELKKHLFSLVRKTKIHCGILKHLKMNNVYKVNNFQSKRMKIKLKPAIKVVIKQKVEEDRKWYLDSRIVYLMKRAKKMKEAILVDKIIFSIQIKKFKPSKLLVKHRIKSLIDREYLERDENDRKFLIYLA